MILPATPTHLFLFYISSFLTMPPIRSVISLKNRTLMYIVRHFHDLLKRNCKKTLTNVITLMEKTFLDIPTSIYSDFFEIWQREICRDKSILNHRYYFALSSIINSRLSELCLTDPVFFQDSSSAMEEFLVNNDHFANAYNLIEIKLFRNVTALIDFDGFRLLRKFYFPKLSVLILQGLVEVTSEDILVFLTSLVKNSPKIRHLDLVSSNTNDEGGDVIAGFAQLSILRLNHTLITTNCVIHLLRRLPSLIRFDCLIGITNRVQEALRSIAKEDPDFRPQLRHFIFRQLKDAERGIDLIRKDIREVKIFFNNYETGFATASDTIDDVLFHLSGLNDVSVDLDLSCFNSLQFVEMNRMTDYGRLIRKIILTEPQFLHPVSLLPLGTYCLNLRTLIITNPSIISDRMFIDDPPSIFDGEYFSNLQDFSFEGQRLNINIIDLILRSSKALYSIEIRCKTFLPEYLLAHKRNPELRRLNLGFHKLNDIDRFLQDLMTVLGSSQKLQTLIISTRKTEDNRVADEIQKTVERIIENNNWELDFSLLLR